MTASDANADQLPEPGSDVIVSGDPAALFKFCSECGKECIAMCPSCGRRVHEDFGYEGNNCSGRHEARCEGARLSRLPKA